MHCAGLLCQRYNIAVLGNSKGIILIIHKDFCLSAVFFSTCCNSFYDFLADSLQLFLVTAARIALNGYQVGHNIGCLTTADNADITSCFLINTAVALNIGKSLGSNHNGVDALFRLQSAMRGSADNVDFIFLLAGSADNNLARSAFTVQCIANVGTQLGAVEATGAVNAALLANSEENLDITMRSAFLQQQANTL